MTQTEFIAIFQDMLSLLLMLSTPMLGAGLLIGVLVSIGQAVTQIQESTLTFVPKLLVSVALLIALAPWMVDSLVLHTKTQLESLEEYAKPNRDKQQTQGELELQPAPSQAP